MAIELTRKEAGDLLYRVFGVDDRVTPLTQMRYKEMRRFELETGLVKIYVENDWKYRDGRIRVGIQAYMCPECIELLFTPVHQRDYSAEGEIRLRHDRERREYWVKSRGLEAAREELDEIYECVYRRPWMQST